MLMQGTYRCPFRSIWHFKSSYSRCNYSCFSISKTPLFSIFRFAVEESFWRFVFWWWCFIVDRNEFFWNEIFSETFVTKYHYKRDSHHSVHVYLYIITWKRKLLITIDFDIQFRKKIKSLLLNVLGNEDNYLNVNYLIEYFVKLTWYVVYTSSCNFSLFQITKSLVLEFICKVFLSVCFCISSFLFFLCNLITPLVKVLSCLD